MPHSDDILEAKTREFIDSDIRDAGWRFEGTAADVAREYRIEGIEGGELGFADYVLFGRDGLPLAVIEAKRASREAAAGLRQAELYADALAKKFGRRPFIFISNGFETQLWDDEASAPRRVSGVFSRESLMRLMEQRRCRRSLEQVEISCFITSRCYQKQAIRAVCADIERGKRQHLLVMATGTGKTRVAASLVDALSRAGRVTNALFLADRTALVRQAHDAFKACIPELSLCNLCSNKDDAKARVVFSTYPTMINAIDSLRDERGLRLFCPAHFDLIIIDESHRSIFKKYRAIFDYFDAQLVGLTATPKTDVARNTYDFFQKEAGAPTFAYDYETAVYSCPERLCPITTTRLRHEFLEEGIAYDELPDDEKERYEEDFAEDGTLPDFIPPESLNEFVFNEATVDAVIEDLMQNGIKIEGSYRLIEGSYRLGKTIIFAENKRHAEFIVQRFNALYPQYKGKFARRIVCTDDYAQTLIDAFKAAEKWPQIAVSVDMMD